MNTERIKVLYVDDEEGNLTAFKASYRRDFDVTTASSAQQALALLEKQVVHVVLSDQRMPVMSGAEFLAEVRERWPKVIRLMLTGFSDIEAVVDAINKGGIHAYITKPWDPTDLKLRIEQAYEVHALRAERERMFHRYHQVFEASGDPIVIVDETGRLLEANTATEKLLGLPRASLLESRIMDFIDAPSNLVKNMKACRQGSAFTNVDIALRASQGNIVDCLMTATYLGNTADGQGLFQAMIKDITDRKHEEQRLKKLNGDLDRRVAARTKQLMEALDDLGAFSYSVAHDLRSPLKSIRSLTDHLREIAALRADADLDDVSGRIHHGASRLINLVDDLLRFARTDSLQVHSGPVDLRETALECIAAMDITDRRVEFTLPLEDEAVLHADRAMLKVALTNLISNALKFTRHADVARIEILHTIENDDQIISVRDNGVGFDGTKSDQVFNVFKRMHQTDQFEGTGIGLAIVQRIVQKHGGACWAESESGKGATIHLRFPGKADELAVRLAS